jgi:hypothetical protein
MEALVQGRTAWDYTRFEVRTIFGGTAELRGSTTLVIVANNRATRGERTAW